MAGKKAPDNTICRNRQASFKYEILESIECGLVLTGTEVKSLRARDGSLNESFARIDDGELWLIGFHIPTYKYGGAMNHDPLRRRKLLIHTSQLRKIRPKIEQKGLTMVPLRVFFSERGLAKVTVGLVRGKSRSDKRHNLRKRDDQRDIERAMKRRK